MRLFVSFILLSLFLSSCWDFQTGTPIEGFAPGKWRGVFKTKDQTIPVTFEVRTNEENKPFDIVFKTGKQVIKAEAVRTYGDTLYMSFQNGNTELKVVYQVDQMDGFLYYKNNERYPVLFAGQYGLNYRFPDVRKEPTADLTGDWNINASITKDSTIQGNLRLQVQKNYAEGTLLFEGESIALEGTVQHDKIYLSGFDGQTVCLVNATILDSKTLSKGSMLINDINYVWSAQASAGVEH